MKRKALHAVYSTVQKHLVLTRLKGLFFQCMAMKALWITVLFTLLNIKRCSTPTVNNKSLGRNDPLNLDIIFHLIERLVSQAPLAQSSYLFLHELICPMELKIDKVFLFFERYSTYRDVLHEASPGLDCGQPLVSVLGHR